MIDEKTGAIRLAFKSFFENLTFIPLIVYMIQLIAHYILLRTFNVPIKILNFAHNQVFVI